MGTDKNIKLHIVTDIKSKTNYVANTHLVLFTSIRIQFTYPTMERTQCSIDH